MNLILNISNQILETSKGWFDDDDIENEEYPMAGKDLLNFQRPFSFLANIGGKDTSSKLLSPRMHLAKTEKFSTNVSRDSDQNSQENSEAYVNIKAELGPTRTHMFTIFHNSNVDDLNKLYKKKPSTARLDSARKRPLSTKIKPQKPPLIPERYKSKLINTL